MNECESRAQALFAMHFGATPMVVASAPGRVNLIGDHVDYAGGIALPATLAMRTAVAISLRSDGARNMTSEHDAPQWHRYCEGVADLLGVGGFDLAVASDLPIGAGLASSAALEVATLRALLAATNASMDVLEGALLCQRAEHEYAGTPCGLMDQIIAMVDPTACALAIDFAMLSWLPIEIPSRAEFLVFDTGVRHRLVEGAYAERRASVERATKITGVEHLSHCAADRVENAPLDAVDRQRARHVVHESARATRAVDALRNEDLATFGDLMFESHASLRDAFEVSIKEADALVHWLMHTPSVYGARITGGGFGGCVVALIERGARDGVVALVQAQFKRRFHRDALLIASVP